MSTREPVRPLQLMSTFVLLRTCVVRAVKVPGVLGGGGAQVMVIEDCSEPVMPRLSVTDAVMVCEPAVSVRENDGPFPIAPIRLDVQRRFAETLPSRGSVALPEKLIAAPSGYDELFAGLFIVTVGGAFVVEAAVVP